MPISHAVPRAEEAAQYRSVRLSASGVGNRVVEAAVFPQRQKRPAGRLPRLARAQDSPQPTLAGQ
jgi:hypothetical protein